MAFNKSDPNLAFSITILESEGMINYELIKMDKAVGKLFDILI
jgi:hypothetical protein